MHDWIMKQDGDGPNSVNIEEATEYAKAITGADGDTLASVIGGIDVNNQMRLDILTKNNVWRKNIPVLMVDNRLVPRWRSDDVSANELFKKIIQSVKSESGDASSR
jgi:shikimate kinase